MPSMKKRERAMREELVQEMLKILMNIHGRAKNAVVQTDTLDAIKLLAEIGIMSGRMATGYNNDDQETGNAI